MIPILSGNVASAIGGAYEVANSCRFDDGSSAYMHKTPGSEGNKRKWTFSTWYKKGNAAIDGNDGRWITVGADANNRDIIYHGSTNMIGFMGVRSGSASFDVYTTNNIHRDVSAWYHLVVAVDTEQATAANRVKMYLNNVQLTASNVLDGSTSYPAEDLDTYFCDDVKHIIGKEFADTTYFDGYLAETILVDGSQLTPSSFGEFDEDSPTIWKPKDVSGFTFGTNGFYLDYEDSANLGNDANGGTDFTEVNLAAADQATDTPTNNFCTMNPLDNYYPASTFSEGNCKVVQGGSAFAWNLSTIAVTAGKWYAEAKLTTSGTYALVGITDTSPTSKTTKIIGSGAYDYSVYQYNGDLYNNAGDNPANDDANYAASYASGDIIGIALDITNSKIYFSKNGAWSDGSGSWDSSTFNASVGAVTITAPASTNNGHYFFGSGDYESGSQPTWEWNFGGCPPNTISSGNSDENGYGNFEYAVPRGYLALCTKNLGSDGG